MAVDLHSWFFQHWGLSWWDLGSELSALASRTASFKELSVLPDFFRSYHWSIRHHTQIAERSFKNIDDLKACGLSSSRLEDRLLYLASEAAYTQEARRQGHKRRRKVSTNDQTAEQQKKRRERIIQDDPAGRLLAAHLLKVSKERYSADTMKKARAVTRRGRNRVFGPKNACIAVRDYYTRQEGKTADGRVTKKSTAKKKKKRDLSGLKAQAEASGDLAVVGGSVTGLNMNQLPVDFIRTLFEDINRQAPGTFDCTGIIEGKDKPQPVSKATAKAR